MSELAREARWRPARDAEIVRRDKGVGLGETALPVVSLALVGYAIHIGDPVIRAFCGTIGLVGAVLAFVLRLARRDDRRREGYDAIRDEFAGDYGWLVSMIVRQGDAPTGEDVGLLWLDEDRLYFSGRRTSFGLTPGQVRGVGRVREGVPGVRNPVEIALRRDTAAGAMALSFEPILPPYESEFVHRAALRTELAEWAGGRAEGAGQFPPAIIGPGVVGEHRLLRDALAVTFPVPVALAVFLHFVLPALAVASLIPSLFLVVGAVPAANLRWRALRDRQRLRRAV